MLLNILQCLGQLLPATAENDQISMPRLRNGAVLGNTSIYMELKAVSIVRLKGEKNLGGVLRTFEWPGGRR